METIQQNKLTFNGVNIVDVQFNIQQIFNEDVRIELKTDAKFHLPKDHPSVFHIMMDVELKADGFFVLNVRSLGEFILSEDVDDKLKKQFININAPAIMFPYIRAFISTFTANCGNTIKQLNIPTQFFSGDLDEVL